MTSRLFRNCFKFNKNLLKLNIVARNRNGRSWNWSATSLNARTTTTRTTSSTYLPSASVMGSCFRRSFCMVETNSEEILKFTDENFEQLRKEIQNNGFINHQVFEKLIITTPRKDITDENALLLITCCAHFLPSATFTEKYELFRKTWNQLQSDTKLSRDHYLAALDVFRANKFPMNDYKSMLKDVKFEKDAEIYEGLIGLACEHGDMDEATEILKEMKDKQYPITERVFNSLILGYSRKQDLINSENVLSTMLAANLEPSHKTYTELVKAYLENDVPERALQLLAEHKDEFKIEELVGIMKSAALNGDADVIEQILSMLPVDMVKVLELPMKVRMLCTELIFGDHLEAAVLIMNSYPTPKFTENQDIDRFGVSLINDCVKTHQPTAKIIKICKDLMLSGKNPRALHVAASIALRWDPKTGMSYLKALAENEKLRCHYFWPLILHNASKDGEIGVINTLKSMTELGVEVDYETMSSYIFPRLSITCKDVKKAVIALEDAGLKTNEILTPLVSHLLLQQRLNDIVWILQTYQSKINTEMLVKPLISIATNLRASKNPSQLAQVIALLQTKAMNPKIDVSGEVLLEMLNSNKHRTSIDSELISDLVKEFSVAGVKISGAAADALKDFMGSTPTETIRAKTQENISRIVAKGMTLKSADKLGIHPRDMSLEDLECHLVELENKGMNTRGVLRRLLQLAVREKKFERAYEIYKKCLHLKVQRSPGMMASVFEMFVRLGKVEEASNTIQELKRTNPGFLLDEHKVIDYATRLVQAGRINEAKTILKERATATKIQGGEYVSKNVWELLNATAHYSANTNPKGQRNETRDMLEYVNSLGYCAFNNVHLGCIIREYLLKKQIFPAIAEFRRIVTQYRKTPLQAELMSELVRVSSSPGNEHYQSMLQEVVREVTKIHGALNTNIYVILAIAENGTQSQLRKLLMDPQFKFNEENLMRNCEHLSSTGKIDILLKLARATRGLGHMIKENELYSILLNSFSRENNFKAAIDLYDRLEADDELKISQDFVKGLVDLLRRNNLDIPKNVALRARMTV